MTEESDSKLAVANSVDPEKPKICNITKHRKTEEKIMFSPYENTKVTDYPHYYQEGKFVGFPEEIPQEQKNHWYPYCYMVKNDNHQGQNNINGLIGRIIIRNHEYFEPAIEELIERLMNCEKILVERKFPTQEASHTVVENSKCEKKIDQIIKMLELVVGKNAIQET